MRWDIINQLIKDNGYQSYLEIGVYNKAWNFDKIKCKKKVGVDPNKSVGATFALTSDDFFAQNKEKFDIIFIDGLHHYEQVSKDIHNSLNALNAGGSIVVHDCNPTTKEMQQVPRIQGEWTGDVWRAWIEYRLYENLSMKVYDVDYGVGVIQRGNQQPFRIEGKDLTYENFAVNKKEWLNLVPYPDTVKPVSICIPVFEQYGKGDKMITKLLDSLKGLKGNHEIIVSDNSDNDTIRTICKNYPVKYYHNPVKGISANTNYAISKASHDLIKIMYQDDLCLSDEMANEFSKALDGGGWAVCHSLRLDERGIKGKEVKPVYTDDIIKGRNTIGMPSVIGFNLVSFEFDTNLKTLLDCEFYWRLFKRYGLPKIITKPLVGQRYWNGSTSRKQGNFTETEYKYLQDKWAELK